MNIEIDKKNSCEVSAKQEETNFQKAYNGIFKKALIWTFCLIFGTCTLFGVLIYVKIDNTNIFNIVVINNVEININQNFYYQEEDRKNEDMDKESSNSASPRVETTSKYNP